MGRTRRSFLAGLVAVIAGLAGCSSFLDDRLQSDDSGPPPLFGIGILTFDTKPHDVDLLVRRNDEIVHWERYPIPSAEPFEKNDAVRGVEVLADSPAWPGCGAYEILARLDEGATWAQIDLSEPKFSDNRQAPRMVRVQIRNDGSFSSFTVEVDQTLDCSTR